MIKPNRTETHKRIEISNETFDRLARFKIKIDLARFDNKDYNNQLGWDGAILLAVKLAEAHLYKQQTKEEAKQEL